MPVWSVYLLRCADDTLYTGIATDVDRRVREHRSGKRGAKRLRGRGPLQLVFECAIGDRALASRLEYRIKQLPKDDKERFVRAPDAFRAHLRSLSAECEPTDGDQALVQDSHSRRVSSSAGK